MFDLLNQPYPSHELPGRQLRTAAVIGLFIGLFLLVFQPFGLTLWETPNKTLKILGFGLIAFLITAINFTVWTRLFPRQFSDERWTVGREILLVTTNILLIAIANRLYLEWVVHQEGGSGVVGWLSMILVTFLLGVFPTAGAVLFNYIRQLKKYSQSAAQFPAYSSAPGMTTNLPAETHSIDLTEKPIKLVADNEKDTLVLDIADLLFIESSDNYCTVVYQQGNKVSKPLLRSSLSRLAGQINQPHIVRCHRSYLVNLDRVERVTGNAQGYKLHLSDGNFMVPVSRQYNDTLVAELKGL